MAVNLNFGAWVKVARTFCGQASLTLRWVSEEEIERVGAQAWTDSRSIYTRRPSQTWTDKQFMLWLYYLLHEVGHNRPGRRDVFKVLEKYKPTGLLAYVNNLLEDNVQEHDIMDCEPTLTHKMSEGRAAYYRFTLDQAVADPERVRRARENPQGPTLFSWDAGVRASFQRDVAGFSAQLLADVEHDPQVQEWTRRLQDGGYADVLRDKPDVWQVFDLAKRIVAEVFEQDPEGLHDSKGQAGGEGGGEGQPGEGQGQGQGEGQGQGQGQGQEQGEAKDGQPGKGEGHGAGQEDYADWLVGHNHSSDKRSGNDERGKKGAGLTISYDKYFSSGIRGDTFVADLDGLKIYDAVNKPPHDNSYEWAPTPSSTLSKRVARYLQAQTRNRKLYGQKKGRLSNRSLYRLKLKGAGEIRKRVFDQRIINKSKDVAVQVLVDLSGSMGNWGKAENAIAAATHLHEVISQQLHIPLEILGFSETRPHASYGGGLNPCHGIVVTFQEFGKPRTTEVVNAGLRRVMNFQGCNRDGEAIMWARERLLRQKTSRRIMIVISDGQPKTAGNRSLDIAAFTKEVVEKVEREGQIEMYAIGLKTDSVRHFYKHYRVINDPAQLEEALLGVLKDKILNEVTV